MAEVIWSPNALDCLVSAAEYIATDSPHQATLFVAHALKAVERIAVFPRSGRVIPEMADASRREVLFGAYRIMYNVEHDQILITEVVHGSPNWSPE